MKDHYTLELTSHQAHALHAALNLVNRLLELPPDTPVYPKLASDGIEQVLVTDELKLLHEEIKRQFQEQDHA
jgi:hypothetical protein